MSRRKGTITDEHEDTLERQFRDEKRRQYDEDLKAVMRTEVGRRFVWRMLHDMTQFFSGCGSNVALELARHDGIRLVGKCLTDEVLRVAGPDYVHMYQDAVRAQADEDLRRQEAQAQEE